MSASYMVDSHALLSRFRRSLALTCIVGSACSVGPPTAQGVDDERAPIHGRRRIVHVVDSARWERNITHTAGATLPPTALRAGYGLAAAVFGASQYHWKFDLARRGHPAAGGVHRAGVDAFHPPMRERSEIVGIARTGHVWYLDRVSGRVVSEDVGGYGALVARLAQPASVRTACALGERAIAYVDVTLPGHVVLRDLQAASPPRMLPIATTAAGDLRDAWANLRFSGSADGQCVLWAPQLPVVLVVSDSVIREIPLSAAPPPNDAAKPQNRIWDRVVRVWRRRSADVPAAATLDVASVPAGIAVLVSVPDSADGRLIDLYMRSGEYVASLSLPRRAVRIAGVDDLVVAISADRDSVFLASYELPIAGPNRHDGERMHDEPAQVAAPRLGQQPGAVRRADPQREQ